LFLPVIGLSLIIGAVFAWLYDLLGRIHASVAAAAIALIFFGVFYGTSRSISADVEHSRLLGGSATLALDSLTDLKHLYPVWPAQATLYFADAENSLVWDHDFGGLIKAAYGSPNLAVLYQSLGHRLQPDMQNPVILRLHHGRLTDETTNDSSRRELFKFA